MVMEHALSFDVEHWYDGNLHRQWTWQPTLPGERLQGEVDRLLDLLDRYQVQATFFILGRIALEHPGVVRAIARRGHEVGCHGLEHLMIPDAGVAAYGQGLVRSRGLLQDLSGQPVRGHRAPSWSLDPTDGAAVDAVLAAGFTYDSSIFPMRTPLYGTGGAPIAPFQLVGQSGGRLLELPPAVARVGPMAIPFGGGLYWRVLPLWLIRMLLRLACRPQVTYLHPWELNPTPVEAPPDLPFLPHLVLRVGTRSAMARLERLIRTFRFVPMATQVDQLLVATDVPVWTPPSMEGGWAWVGKSGR